MSAATLAARLALDKTFCAAPLSARGPYRLLLDHADRSGRIVAPGLDAVAVVRATLHCSHGEAEEVLHLCVKHRLVAVLDEGVELLVASQGTDANGATLADLTKRLNADFSYRALATPDARRAWLASEDGRRRVATLGLTASEADAIADNAGRRGRRASVISNTDEMQRNDRANTEQLQIDSRQSVETHSIKAIHSITEVATSNTDSITETVRAGAAEGVLPPPSSPSLSPSKVLPSHTLPSPTSPKPTQLHPPPSTPHATPDAARDFTLVAVEPTTTPDVEPKARSKSTDALPPAPGTAAARIAEAIGSAPRLAAIVAKPNELAVALSAAEFVEIDVVAEIGKADRWLLTNPKHAKKNGARFLNEWINNASERAQSRAARASQRAGTDSPSVAERLGFGAAEVIEAMAKYAGGNVRLTTDTALTARLDALIAEVSESWSKANGEVVTIRHWQAFSSWLKNGGASGGGGLAEWWGRDKNGNQIPGYGKPGLAYFITDGRLAKHFDEAMEWWAKYRDRRRREKAEAEKAARAAHEGHSTNPIAPEVSDEERAQMRASAASTFEKLRARAGRSIDPMKRPTESR